MRYAHCAMVVLLLLACKETHFNLAPETEQLLSTPVTFQRGLTIESLKADELASGDVYNSIIYAIERNTNYIQLVVTWYMPGYVQSTLAPSPTGTPTDAALAKAIQVARNEGQKVFLSPRLRSNDGVHRSLITPIDFSQWFDAYENFLLHYAAFATRNRVDVLSIGTGLSSVTSTEPSRWEALIQKINNVYQKKLTYSADWDEYQNIPFWSSLDFIGVEAFFPLTQLAEPRYEDLYNAWLPWLDQMETLSAKIGKQILITNIGYTSQDRTNIWPADPNISGALDLQEQALCYTIFFDMVRGKRWLEGVYWWGWTPVPTGGEQNLMFTPRHKPADIILTRNFQALQFGADS